jgi:hypothetical protein
MYGGILIPATASAFLLADLVALSGRVPASISEGSKTTNPPPHQFSAGEKRIRWRSLETPHGVNPEFQAPSPGALI